MKSFEIGNYVYFFFRERTLECSSCGKLKISRVARICKVIICKLSIKKYPNGLERYFGPILFLKACILLFFFHFRLNRVCLAFWFTERGIDFCHFGMKRDVFGVYLEIG